MKPLALAILSVGFMFVTLNMANEKPNQAGWMKMIIAFIALIAAIAVFIS
jgi:hypothetical protein